MLSYNIDCPIVQNLADIIKAEYLYPIESHQAAEAFLGSYTQEKHTLLLCQIKPKGDADFAKIEEFIQNTQETAMILITDADCYNEVCRKFPYSPEIVILHDSMPKQILRNSLERLMRMEYRGQIKDKFCKIPISYFLENSRTPCAIYVALNENKYVKLLCAHDLFESHKIFEYQQKKCEHVHIRQEDFNSYFNNVYGLSHQEVDLYDLPSCLQSSQRTQDFLRTTIQKIGIDEKVLELTNNAMEQMVDQIMINSNLTALWNRFINMDNYLPEHSILLAYIACAVAKESDKKWSNPETYWKLNIASFFHDITIEDPKIAKIDDLDSTEFQKLSTKERKRYLRHPEEACQYLAKLEGTPPDVFTIMTQHHEKVDGSGFPHKINSSRIAPLATIFILAHSFTDQIYEVGADKFQPLEALKEIEDRYEGNKSFAKYCSILKNIIDKDIKDKASAS